jgi:hypothetical protein
MGLFSNYKKDTENDQQFSKLPDLSLNQESPNIQSPFKVFDLMKKNPTKQELNYLLTVLETAVKNRKKWVQEEIVKESNCEIFAKLIITTPHEEVRDKMMSLIQVWAFKFKEPPKYCALEV